MSRFNFLGLDETLSNIDTAKVQVLPVPYDLTVSYRTGTRNGPNAIIDASRFVELFDIEAGRDISDIGIATLDELEPISSSPEDMNEFIYSASKEILDAGRFQVTLGGDHSISLGVVKAHAEKFKDLTVIQFDAHADLRDSYMGSKFSHASIMRRVSEITRTVQIGVRSMSEPESRYVKEKGLHMFYAHNIKKDSSAWIDNMLALLTENVYITFDLDLFDPAIMPAVGTPEPGGLLWYETIEILRRISLKSTIVGFDVVELAPIAGNVAPDFLTAKLIYKLIGYIFTNHNLK